MLPEASGLPAEAREDLIRRLRKIEGQTQGIQRMLADGRACREVLNQLASVRAATHRVSLELMKHYALACLQDPHCMESEQDLADLIDMLLRLPT
ncbi:MAG TPA: metal-sensitive transcriptional regulator [Chloroflexi bacterium]|jgi:DNA-binding FrmR family transcriptional regulator|nr:metal-sensitive transcriptional regulator [Chloroflexota bacterium]